MKKAVIFDMDGVISNTQGFHAVAESKILKEFGINICPEKITAKYAGVSDDKMFAEILKENKIAGVDISKVIFKKWEIMQKITKGKITAIPYAIDLIKLLHQENFKLAIASASPLFFINFIINELKIGNYFNAIVSSEEVRNGKPCPDIFLLAAKRLKINPLNCVVIEDGKSGMIGAKKAGMKVIGLANDAKKDLPADLIVSNLRDLSLKKIEKLLI
ncbi:HAD family phosphatase [Candidatus Microgenomates bacterium]|nr:MAG: HAD family phosphatase [Candidatus Microgenomates bacterium]